MVGECMLITFGESVMEKHQLPTRLARMRVLDDGHSAESDRLKKALTSLIRDRLDSKVDHILTILIYRLDSKVG